MCVKHGCFLHCRVSRRVRLPETVDRPAGSAGAYWDGAHHRGAPAHEAHRAGAAGVGHDPTPSLATPADVLAVAVPAAAPSVTAAAVPSVAVVADRRDAPVAVGEVVVVVVAAAAALAHEGRLWVVDRRTTAWKAEENGRPRPCARPWPGTGPSAAPIPQRVIDVGRLRFHVLPIGRSLPRRSTRIYPCHQRARPARRPPCPCRLSHSLHRRRCHHRRRQGRETLPFSWRLCVV